MGIFDALNTAVGGLQAQSFSLQNISGNIANASTIGYKGIDTTFEDLIPDATSPAEQVAGGVTAYAQQTITTQGTNTATTVATNMAIIGNGFFDVQMPTGTVDNQPVFSGVTDYTQRGDFQVNSNGNLVNGAGYYLMGVPVDPTTGNPVGNVPQVLQFQNNFVPAQATIADHLRRQPSCHPGHHRKRLCAGRHAAGGGRARSCELYLGIQPIGRRHAGGTAGNFRGNRQHRKGSGDNAGRDNVGHFFIGGGVRKHFIIDGWFRQRRHDGRQRQDDYLQHVCRYQYQRQRWHHQSYHRHGRDPSHGDR